MGNSVNATATASLCLDMVVEVVDGDTRLLVVELRRSCRRSADVAVGDSMTRDASDRRRAASDGDTAWLDADSGESLGVVGTAP